MKITNKSILILLLAVCFLVISACGSARTPSQPEPSKETVSPEPEKPQTHLERIQASGKLRFGTSPDRYPYSFRQSIGGKEAIAGIDINIAMRIAADLGVELEIYEIPLDELMRAVSTGKVDLAMAGLLPENWQLRTVGFSKPVYKVVNRVIIRELDSEKYSVAEDFVGRKVGVQPGTVQERFAKARLPGSELIDMLRPQDLIAELKAKGLEGIVLEDPLAAVYISAHPELTYAGPGMLRSIADEDGLATGTAVAMLENSVELVAAVNAAIKNLQSEGRVDTFVVDAAHALEFMIAQ